MIYIGDQMLKARIRVLELKLKLKDLECEQLALLNEHLRQALKANIAAVAQFVPSEAQS